MTKLAAIIVVGVVFALLADEASSNYSAYYQDLGSDGGSRVGSRSGGKDRFRSGSGTGSGRRGSDIISGKRLRDAHGNGDGSEISDNSNISEESSKVPVKVNAIMKAVRKAIGSRTHRGQDSGSSDNSEDQKSRDDRGGRDSNKGKDSNKGREHRGSTSNSSSKGSGSSSSDSGSNDNSEDQKSRDDRRGRDSNKGGKHRGSTSNGGKGSGSSSKDSGSNDNSEDQKSRDDRRGRDSNKGGKHRGSTSNGGKGSGSSSSEGSGSSSSSSSETDIVGIVKVNGGWTSWSSSSVCSAICGGGLSTRERTCTNPAPSSGGKPCKGGSQESLECNTQDCAVDGEYTEWTPYTDCSVSCGGGERTRERFCTNPAPSGSGRPCKGDSQESSECKTQECAVDGEYTEWTPYTACSVSCGVGERTRERFCTNPAPSGGGRRCEGDGLESEECNNQDCAVDGVWTTWTPFSDCSKTCEGGEKTRERSCTNPPPSNGGELCDGDDTDSMECNTDVECAVDGDWTEWTPYTDCSVSCGGGEITRERFCTNPSPSSGGRPCKGDDLESDKCNTHQCADKPHY